MNEVAEDLKGEHLYSLLIAMRAHTSGSLPPYAGQMAHAALLRWIAAVDPACATRLHEPNQWRPFTCSPLLFPMDDDGTALYRRPSRVMIHPHQVYYLRLSLLTERLFHLFLLRFFPQTIQRSEQQECSPSFPQVLLGEILFNVMDISSEAALQGTQERLSRWSSYTTYAQLVDEARSLDLRQARNGQMSLEFCSPTTFSNGQGSGGKLYWLFPDPERVFGNLARSWNRWCPPQFTLDLSVLLAYLRERVNAFPEHLETREVYLDFGTQPGFVGRCVYSLLERPAYTTACGAAQVTPGQALHMLHRYSLFAGVGQKTAMGMGQVRPLI